MDNAWSLYLNGLPERVPALSGFAVALARYAIVLYGAPVLWLWWRRGAGAPEGRRRILILSVLAAVLALGFNFALNAAFPRPRPYLVLPEHVLVPSPPHDPSFPSDHVAVAASVATTLLIGGEAGWGVLALVGAALIGAARVIVGLHYPADVLGGLLVGAACAAIVTRAQRTLQPALNVILEAMRRLGLA